MYLGIYTYVCVLCVCVGNNFKRGHKFCEDKLGIKWIGRVGEMEGENDTIILKFQK